MSRAIQKHIDRRAVIKGATIATATGLVSAAALRATIAQAAPVAALAQPDPLLALGAAVEAAQQRCNRAAVQEDEACAAARKAGFNVSHPMMAVGRYSGCCSVREIKRAAEEAGFGVERQAELIGVYRRRLAQRRQQSIAAGLRPFEVELRNAEREWRRAMQAIVTTPAISYAGLAVKLRLIKEEMEDGKTSHGDELAQSAYRDAQRLAAGGAA